MALISLRERLKVEPGVGNGDGAGPSARGRRVVRALARALLLGLLVQGAAPAVAPAGTAGQITVEGVGMVRVVPDRARLRLGVVVRAARGGEAMAAMARRMRAVVAALEKAGIARERMATTGLMLRPVMAASPGKPPRVTGYEARETLTVTVDAIERVGALVDLAMAKGANRIDGIDFDVAGRKQLAAEARTRAVKDALERAREMAAAAGLQLGAIRALEEIGSGARPGPVPVMRAMEAAPPILAGTETVTARVRLVIAISGDGR